MVVVVYEGAFDGRYRSEVRAHVAGSLKLKEPREVHRDLRVHAPFTSQVAARAPELVAAVADALGVRGPVHFEASGFAPGERAPRSSRSPCTTRSFERTPPRSSAPRSSPRR